MEYLGPRDPMEPSGQPGRKVWLVFQGQEDHVDLLAATQSEQKAQPAIRVCRAQMERVFKGHRV